MDLTKVVRGKGPAPSLVLCLIEGLPDDSSMTRALAGGGTHLMGWGNTNHLLASIYDALNLNTRATGNWEKGKAPKFEPYPRGGAEAKAEPVKKKTTVADLFRRMS